MANSNPHAIQVKGLSKRFRQGKNAIDALKNISLEVQNGELLMIVGPSGCGKTTLLSAIAGTLFFDEGEIHVFDQALHHLDQKKMTRFRRQQIGFIFQQYHLIPTLNCLENTMIPLLLNKVSNSIAEKEALCALEKVGLKGRERDFPKTLSGGQQQRVAIARAIVHQPRLIICDEPTAALDGENGQKVMDLIKGMVTGTNHCVLVVTHDSRIFKYADRMIEMNDGCVIHSS